MDIFEILDLLDWLIQSMEVLNDDPTVVNEMTTIQGFDGKHFDITLARSN